MKRSHIRVTNHNKGRGLNERFIKGIVADILKALKRPRHTELEIVFLSDERIRGLNKKYRGSDSATDVLSFDLGGEEFGKRAKFMGEVLISSDTAARNAKAFGTTFGEEIVLYVIHGMLHLFGYDDGDAVSGARMSKREKEILKKICMKEDLSKVSTRP
jgi:probable rRNA maturation factor